MAVFNPEPPHTSDPNYLGMSKPITGYEGDKSWAAAISGFGNVLDTTVKGVDFLVKDKIEKQIHAAVDQERDAFTAALQQTKDSMTGKNVQVAGNIPRNDDPMGVTQEGVDGATKGPQNILSTLTKPVPAALDKQLGYLGNIHSAYEGDKLSPTYYESRLNEIAKSMRAQYPGYREYIDKEIATMIGHTPANALVTGMITDINRIGTDMKAEQTKIWNLFQHALEKGYDVKSAYQYYLRTGDANTLVDTIHQRASEEASDKADERMEKRLVRNLEGQKVFAEDRTNTYASNRVAYFMQNLRFGLNNYSFDDLMKMYDDHRSGEKRMTGEEVKMVTEALKQAKTQAFRDFMVWGQRTRGPDIGKDPTTGETLPGRTMALMLGGKKAEEGTKRLKQIFDENFAFVDDVIGQFAGPNQFALFTDAADRASAILDKTQLDILKSYPLGMQLAIFSVVKKLGGDNMITKWIDNSYGMTAGPDGTSTNLLDLNEGARSYVRMMALNFMTNTGPANFPTPRPNKPDGSPGPVTLNQGLDALRQMKIASPEAVNFLISQAPTLLSKADTPEPLARNLAWAAFSPDNRGLLEKLAADGGDRFWVFGKMTDVAVVNRTKALGGEAWDDHKDWVQHSFGKILVPGELQKLNDFQKETAQHMGSHIKWNDQTHELSVVRPTGRNKGPDAYYNGVQERLDRINKAMKGMKNIAEASKADVTEFLVDALQRWGQFDPTINTQGIPAQIMDSIRAAKQGGKVPSSNTTKLKDTSRVGE